MALTVNITLSSMANKIITLAFLAMALLTSCGIFKKQGVRTTSWTSSDMEQFGYGDVFEFDEITEKHLLKNGFNSIRGGTFVMGQQVGYPQYSSADSNAWFESYPRRVTVASFYLQKTEVTNKEYREFTTWVRDSIARTLLSVKNKDYLLDTISGKLNWNKAIDWTDTVSLNRMYVPLEKCFMGHKKIYTDRLIYRYKKDEDSVFIAVYPDTLCWLANYFMDNKERYEDVYFRKSAFDNHPVVGVSYRQALAYCDWKTKMLNIPGHLINVRLPSAAEFEYAMTDLPVDNPKYWNEDKKPGKEERRDLNNRFNFFNSNGSKDANNMILIYPDDDGYLRTSPVKSYRHNSYGVYDLRGNVAEWTFDGLNLPDGYRDQVLEELDRLQLLGIAHIDLFNSKCAIDFFKGSTYLTFDTTCNRTDQFEKEPMRYILNFGFWGPEWNVDVPGIYGQLPDLNYLKEQVCQNMTIGLKDNVIINSSNHIDGSNIQSDYNSLGYVRYDPLVRFGNQEFVSDEFDYSKLVEVDNRIDDFYYLFDRLNTLMKKYQALKGRQKVYGGSWADPVVYSIPSLIQCFPAEAQKSTIGFRCAVTNVNGFGKRKVRK